MQKLRKPFQGVLNILRFNWHFYVLSIGGMLFLYFGGIYLGKPFQYIANSLIILSFGVILLSLLVSYYIYDLSGLYRFRWMDGLRHPPNAQVVNIHAGFDETSVLIQHKFPTSTLSIFDFYDPKKHTEISIKRARKAYPTHSSTKVVNTAKLPPSDSCVDLAFVIFSAHEIREEGERNHFFQELRRIIQPTGQIIITEHLRDLPNFLAYNIGFFHFMPKSVWLQTFAQARLMIVKELKINPFVTTFILEKHGTPS